MVNWKHFYIRRRDARALHSSSHQESSGWPMAFHFLLLCLITLKSTIISRCFKANTSVVSSSVMKRNLKQQFRLKSPNFAFKDSRMLTKVKDSEHADHDAMPLEANRTRKGPGSATSQLHARSCLVVGGANKPLRLDPPTFSSSDEDSSCHLHRCPRLLSGRWKGGHPSQHCVSAHGRPGYYCKFTGLHAKFEQALAARGRGVP